MAEEKKKQRNYIREAETAKARGEAVVGVKTTKKIADDFAAKCADNGVTKASVLKDYIIRYTYENFDQPDRG